MSELGDRKNAGKARYDLIPWADIRVTDNWIPVEAAYDALKLWFTGAPTPLDVPIPRAELRGVAGVLAFGAAKYAPRNWEKGLPYSETFAAAARHAEAVAFGDAIDPESGQLHASHFWCNFLFLVVFSSRNRTDLDDRPPASPATRAKLDRMQAMIDAENPRRAPPTDPKGSN